jgi:hypothetical protein
VIQPLSYQQICIPSRQTVIILRNTRTHWRACCPVDRGLIRNR